MELAKQRFQGSFLLFEDTSGLITFGAMAWGGDETNAGIGQVAHLNRAKAAKLDLYVPDYALVNDLRVRIRHSAYQWDYPMTGWSDLVALQGLTSFEFNPYYYDANGETGQLALEFETDYLDNMNPVDLRWALMLIF